MFNDCRSASYKNPSKTPNKKIKYNKIKIGNI